MQKLLSWLKNTPEIHEGEIQDCLHHFYNEGLIYCESHENRHTVYQGHSSEHYLISFKGKIFIDTIGGYEKEAEFLSQRKAWEDYLLEQGEKNQEKLNNLTLWLSVGTTVLALVEIIKLVREMCGCH